MFGQYWAMALKSLSLTTLAAAKNNFCRFRHRMTSRVIQLPLGGNPLLKNTIRSNGNEKMEGHTTNWCPVLSTESNWLEIPSHGLSTGRIAKHPKTIYSADVWIAGGQFHPKSRFPPNLDKKLYRESEWKSTIDSWNYLNPILVTDGQMEQIIEWL